MKEIKNEPEEQRERREKQVLNNFSAEIELLEFRSESQEEKYTQIDTKMIEENRKKKNIRITAADSSQPLAAGL